MSPLTFSASVIGGGAGGQLSLNAFASSPYYRLLAAADLRPEVREALAVRHPGLQVYPDADALFQQQPTAVVAVSTYAPSHEEVTMAALAMPSLRGLLVEKPLGASFAAGQRILQAVEARGLPLAVPHGLMARRVPLEVIERVHNGEIGDLTLVEIQSREWDIINAGIHWLHFFVNLVQLEPIEWVMAACDTGTRTYRDGLQVETIAVTTAQTRSGIRVVMHTGDDVHVHGGPHQTLFRLIGTRGQLEFFGWKNSYRLLNPAHPNGTMISPEELPVNGHRYHLEELARQIQDGRTDYTMARSSLRALELCEAAYVSHRHRCRVTLPIGGFHPPAPHDWNPGEPYGGTGGGRDGRKL